MFLGRIQIGLGESMEITVGNSLRIAVVGAAIYWLLTGMGFLMALAGKSAYGGLGVMLLVAANACAFVFLVMILPLAARLEEIEVRYDCVVLMVLASHSPRRVRVGDGG